MPKRMRHLPTVILLAVMLAALGRGASALDDPSPEERREQLLSTAEKVTDALNRGRLDREVIAQQTEIVEELKRWLSASQMESPAMSAPQPGPPDPQPGTEPAPASGGPAEGKRTQDEADQAESARTRDEPEPAESAPLPDRPGLADAVWGHLPPREREELLRTFNERYLPRYDSWVRRYFEALAEERDE
jgi:hypothetical protein